MKLWIDDERTPPNESWRWAKNYHDAMDCVRQAHDAGEDIEAISFDHDLGPGWTGLAVLNDLLLDAVYPTMVIVHTRNSVGRKNILAALHDAGYRDDGKVHIGACTYCPLLTRP
jgi:hypothetical protein